MFTLVIAACGIGSEAFEPPDSYGFLLHLVVDASRFALTLLRAYTAADGGKCRGVAQHAGGIIEVSALDVLDKGGYIDVDRTAGDTCRVGTVEAARGFHKSLLGGKTLGHLLAIGDAVGRVEFGHACTGDGCALWSGNCFAQLGAPGGIAIGQLLYTFFVV